jgi:hypothetical protein|tara:strand:+ start:1997 stop:2212 length:216 start_codon:yes stop_codon:yes gene_type:complete
MSERDPAFCRTGSLGPDDVKRDMNSHALEGIYEIGCGSQKIMVPYDQIISTIKEKGWEKSRGTIKGPLTSN